MTVDEFKAWFEGFCDGIEGSPTVDQWAKIRDKVAKLNSTPKGPVYRDIGGTNLFPQFTIKDQ